MITNANFVSISELRDKTSLVMKDLKNVWKKIVLSQNKPIWIFLSIETYNTMQKSNFEKELANEDDIIAYKKSSHSKSWTEAFAFLESLK